MKPYPKAPIVEAVINIRLATAFDDKSRARLLSLGKRDYAQAASERVPNFQINIDVDKPSARVDKILMGVRLTSADQADICLYRGNEFVCSRLAPYLGWDPYVDRAKSDWARLVRVQRQRSPIRVGLRFINRIDVPTIEGEIIRAEDYLQVWARLPDLGDDRRISAYVTQIHRPLDHGCGLIINTLSAQPPLPNYTSFILDLDVFREHDLPTSDADLWQLLSRMREMKNALFEQLITDKARQLFT